MNWKAPKPAPHPGLEREFAARRLAELRRAHAAARAVNPSPSILARLVAMVRP